MKYTITSALVGAAMAAASPLAAAEAIDCATVGASVESAVKANESSVLAVVASKIQEVPDCACDVVKAAIRATKASDELTGQIVEAAVRAAPDQYKIIVECAVAVNSGAAAQIRAALQRVFGGKDGKGGKVVVVPDARKMSPAVAMAFILDGITPTQGLALATQGAGAGFASGMRVTAAIPGGGTSSVFGVENSPPTLQPEEPDGGDESPDKPKPKPRPRPPGGGGGATPTNPQIPNAAPVSPPPPGPQEDPK